MPERDSIILSGSEASLLDGDVAADTIRLGDVRHLYVVSYVHLMPTEDSTFYVVVLPDRLWVIPDMTEALQVFLDAIVPRLWAEGRISQLVANTVPLRWRMRVWRLPLFPTVRLAKQPLDSLPLSRWEERPLDEATTYELTLVKV